MDTETRYRLLKLLESNPDVSQRELAAELGISLGKVNYCLRALIDRGWVKMVNFGRSGNKSAYFYKLTPTGLARFGNRPACVPADLVEELRTRADAESIVSTETPAEFTPGQRVRVIDGPFAGLEGIIQAKTARERVDLLFAVVGQGARTRISTHNLAPC